MLTNSRSQSTLISLSIHATVLALLLLTSQHFKSSIITVPAYLLPLVDPIRPFPGRAAGGGGHHEKTPATEGHLVKIAARQFVPPAIRTTDPNPRLIIEPTVEGPPNLALLDKALPNVGDPLSQILGSSSGSGGPSGIGNGHGTGIGNKSGSSAGDGGSGIGAVYPPGNGVTLPVLIHRVEPEFSEEARKAKYSGTVLIRADIDSSGHARNLRLTRSVGMGLDEKAIEAVAQWLFKPGTKSGKPVAVSAVIEVSFRLL